MEDVSFYRPSDNGYEKHIAEWLRFLKEQDR